MTDGELLLDGSIGDRELDALLLIVLIRYRGLGIELNAARVAHGPGNAHGGKDNPQNGAEPQLGIALDADDALRDQNVEGVDGGCAVAEVGTEEADDERGHGIIAYAQHDGDEDRVKRQGLLGHAERRTADREQDHGDGDDQDVLVLQLLDNAAHAGVQRVGLGDDSKRAADKKNECNDIRRGLDTLGRSLQDRIDSLAKVDGLPRLRIGIDLVNFLIRAGNGDFSLARSRLDGLSIKLTRWNKPCKHREEDDQHKRDGVHMGKLKAKSTLGLLLGSI